MNGTAQRIRILLVDDDPDLVDAAVTFLTSEHEQFDVETASDAEEAEERLADERFDCIVSEYDMPGRNGIDFLRDVRETASELPFILYTGKGSEEVASEAISAGVTDYLQKGSGTGDLTVLANRIENAVEAYRSSRERKLERTNRLLTSAEKLVDAGAWELEADSRQRADGIQTDGLYALHDIPTEADLRLDDWLDYVHPEDRERAEAHVRRLLDDDIPFENEARLVTESGEIRWVHSVGTPVFEEGEIVKYRGAMVDVTERREYEHALEKERNRLDALFENLPNPVVYGTLSPDDAVIREVNPAFEKTFGCEADNVSGMSLHDVILPDELSSEEELARIIEQMRGQNELSTEVRRETVDGPCDFRLDVTIRRPDEGPAEGYAIYTDITEQKERQEALERQNERLDEFASLLSHDLRNPLNAAVTHLALARQECESDHLGRVERSHNRMKTLIDDVLTLAREGKTVTSTDPVDLAELCEMIAYDMETGDATVDADTNAVIRADRNRLHRLLENLIRNAVEHGGDAVTVTIGDLPDGFYVEDDGRGLPEMESDELFQAGVSTSAGGTGFGLSIVREIAEAHDWQICATESNAGGARFEITGVASASAP